MTAECSPPGLADLLASVRAWCQMQLAVEEVAQAEAVAQAVGQAVAAVVWTEALAQCGTRAGYAGPRRTCACGGTARFVGYRSRWLRGLPGEAQVSRAYYHCAACQTGSLPWDATQGLNERLWTPAVKALVAELCALLPYREAGRLLTRLLRVELAESSLEELTAEVGQRVRAAEGAAVEACFTALAEVPPEPGAAPATSPAAPPPARLYVGIDAAKAHVDGTWHDVKCATVFTGQADLTPATRPASDPPARDRVGTQRYTACQETAAAFGLRVYVTALRSGLAPQSEVVVLGDGADWIWNLAAEHFGGATEILDYWHACEHVWKLVPTLYGEGSNTGRRWAEWRCQDLKERGPTGLLRALRRRRGKTPEAREALRLAIGYFAHHRARMQYPAFRQRGLLIGSGPVEATCKVVVGQRLKGAGMRWSQEGADAILALRPLVLNGRADQLSHYAWAA